MVKPPNSSPGADWRRRAAYDYTAVLPRRGWAWEFLRRDAAYRQAWSEASAAVAIERPAPNLTVMTARTELPELADWCLFFRRCARADSDRGRCLLGFARVSARSADPRASRR